MQAKSFVPDLDGMCACGNPSGTNAECERCVLISELRKSKPVEPVPLVVAVADLFSVPVRFSSAVWDAMDDATRRKVICDIVDVGRK